MPWLNVIPARDNQRHLWQLLNLDLVLLTNAATNLNIALHNGANQLNARKAIK